MAVFDFSIGPRTAGWMRPACEQSLPLAVLGELSLAVLGLLFESLGSYAVASGITWIAASRCATPRF